MARLNGIRDARECEISTSYLPLLAISVFLSVMQVYARMTIQMRWREWLNNGLVDRWLKNRRYHQLNYAATPLGTPNVA